MLTGLAVTNSANLTFANLELSNLDAAGKTMFSVRYASNVAFDAVEVHGIAGTAQALVAASLTIRDSAGVTIANSEFRDLGAGLNLLNVTRARVLGELFPRAAQRRYPRRRMRPTSSSAATSSPTSAPRPATIPTRSSCGPPTRRRRRATSPSPTTSSPAAPARRCRASS
ncbi:hypothetical protein AB5I41_17605 [Sphingomonas sp. MMS24-JH45]